MFRALGSTGLQQSQLINGFQGTTDHNIIAPGYGIMKIFGLGQAFIKQTTFVGADRSNDAVSTEQLLGVSASNGVTVVNALRIAATTAATIPFSGTFRLFGVV